jgi:hypothetical protein
MKQQSPSPRSKRIKISKTQPRPRNNNLLNLATEKSSMKNTPTPNKAEWSDLNQKYIINSTNNLNEPRSSL